MAVLTAPSIPTPTTSTPPPAVAASVSSEPFGGLAAIRKISVDEYHQMIKHGILKEGEPVELLEGYLVTKMPLSPQHDHTLTALNTRLVRIVPDEFIVRNQCAVTYDASEPEPDITVVRGPASVYRTRHPEPSDTVLVIESSASSLKRDRTDKLRIYARASVPFYWIANLEERVIEVYSNPSGPAETPTYALRELFKPGDSIPIVLDGMEVGRIVVADVLP